MTSLRDIKKRIVSIKSIGKITKAMKMVSAAKLRQAQQNVKKSRRYSNKLESIIYNVSQEIKTDDISKVPLLSKRESKNSIKIFVVTSDKGLCGAFNSNIIRYTIKFIKECELIYKNINIITIGNKGFVSLKKIQSDNIVINNVENIWKKDISAIVAQISDEVCKNYIDESVDNVRVIYNHFHNIVRQEVTNKQMLPLLENNKLENNKINSSFGYCDYEPSMETLLDKLIPQHFKMMLQQSFLESIASEHGARMTSMENATKNTTEISEKLTLQYNRARQANITKELMEIIGGAEALK